MRQEPTSIQRKNFDFIKSNFARLRDCAVEDLIHYTSPWAIYTVDFLNSVAEMQGIDARLDESVVARVRNGEEHRVTEPRVVELLGQAEDIGSIGIEELIGLLDQESSRIGARATKQYKELF